MLRNWSGVGKVLLTFLALAHMLNATQLVWGGWGFDKLPCTCAHVECYATGGEGFANLPCICAHVECYATGLGSGGF